MGSGVPPAGLQAAPGALPRAALSRNLQIVATSVATRQISRQLWEDLLLLMAWFDLAPRAGFEPATNRLTVVSQGFLRIAARGLSPFIFLAWTRQKPLRHRHYWRVTSDCC
jgi:hypothetical protein